MNNEYEKIVFVAYAILWGIAGVTFTILNRKAKTIEKKKRIDKIGFVVIAALLFGVAVLLRLPAPGIATLVIGLISASFLTQKYSFYCPHCLKKTQHLFTSLEYCPKCGAKKETHLKNETK